MIIDYCREKMKTEYVCQDCNKGFQHSKNKEGIFVTLWGLIHNFIFYIWWLAVFTDGWFFKEKHDTFIRI